MLESVTQPAILFFFFSTGYERQKHPLVDAELEKMLLDTHETFKCYPTAMDITLGWEIFCDFYNFIEIRIESDLLIYFAFVEFP